MSRQETGEMTRGERIAIKGLPVWMVLGGLTEIFLERGQQAVIAKENIVGVAAAAGAGIVISKVLERGTRKNNSV